MVESPKLAGEWLYCLDRCSDFVDGVLYADGLVVGSRWDFGSIDLAIGAEGASIGESACDSRCRRSAL